MNTYFQLSAGLLTATLAALTVRRQNAELAMLLGIVGCCMGGVLVLQLLSPVLDYVRQLYAKTGLQSDLLAPLLRACGIALLTQLSASICADAGQSALAKLLELGGAVLCLLLALPLLTAVLSLLEQLVSG